MAKRYSVCTKMMRQLHKKPSSHTKMQGFEYLVYSAFSLCLLVVLVLLPLAPVFASELQIEEPVPAEQQSTEVAAEESSAEEDSAVSTETDAALQEVEVSVEESLEVPQPTSEGEIVPESTTQNEISEVPQEPEITVIQDDTSGETIESDTVELETTSPIVLYDTETVSESELPSTDVIKLLPEGNAEIVTVDIETPVENSIEEAIPNESTPVSQDSADATEEVPEELIEAGETVSANTLTTDENRFSFAKGECTLVSEETFYCAKATAVPVVTHTDRVFAAPDAEGDKEIYIEKDGEIVAITENTVDDESPYYDATTETIVWHRLLDGRYQIISYDIDSEEETQITHDRYNNMHPSSYDGKTVWQGWVGNDWEIFLLEGNELTMVTDNATHDITPSVNGTHIIWQSFETGVWQMKVYDIRTKEVHTIEDTDGGSIQNPRFVLVYDTKFESGDVETRGYDLVSGEVVPLSAAPAQIPDKIPDPDQTGEKSALVSPQTQLKTKVEEVDVPESSGGDGGVVPDLDVTDIVVPSFSGSTTQMTDLTEPEIDGLLNDIVVSPIVSEEASSTEHIADIIVTPYTEPIESTDLDASDEPL